MNENTKTNGSLLDICILLVIIVMLLAAIAQHKVQEDTISTAGGTDHVYVIGSDMPPGEIQIRHIEGDGYMEIIENGIVRCFSTTGAERLLPGRMKVELTEGDTIHVSKGLKLIMEYRK